MNIITYNVSALVLSLEIYLQHTDTRCIKNYVMCSYKRHVHTTKYCLFSFVFFSENEKLSLLKFAASRQVRFSRYDNLFYVHFLLCLLKVLLEN